MRILASIGAPHAGKCTVSLTEINIEGTIIGRGTREIPDGPDPNAAALLDALRDIATEINLDYTGDVPFSRRGLHAGVCEMRDGIPLFIKT